jgi:hypothetical protein
MTDAQLAALTPDEFTRIMHAAEPPPGLTHPGWRWALWCRMAHLRPVPRQVLEEAAG